MPEPTKKTNQERIKEITDSIETGIRELFESDRFTSYLSTMSRFHRYSVNNQILIHMQRPDATQVAGFNAWKDKFGRHVKKGEKGIQILAPTATMKKIQQTVLDPDTKAPMLDEDGNVMTEEKTVRTVSNYFKPVTVFDVSQTEGKPLPHLAMPLTGDVAHYEAFVEALRRSSPVPIEFENMAVTTDGYFSADKQRIAIRPGMSQVQTVTAIVHEIGHSKLHDYDRLQAEARADGDKEPVKKDRRTEEVEAESVAYAVCQYYGIETSENSFGYIAAWSKGKELKELKASLGTINKTVSALVTDIDRNLKEIYEERGLDQAKADPDPETEHDKDATTEANAEAADSPVDVAAVTEATSQSDPYLAYATAVADHAEELFRAGLISRPFSQDKAEFVQMYADVLRRSGPQHAQEVLDDYASKSGYPTPEVLQSKLNELQKLWNSGLSYQLQPSELDPDEGFISAYGPDGQTYMSVLFSGPTEVCERVLHDLEQGSMTPEQAQELDTDRPWENEVPVAEAPEPEKLDEYPMPDAGIAPDALETVGCKDPSLLPLARDRAMELFAEGFTVYTIDEHGEALMCFDDADLAADGDRPLALEKYEWEKSPDFRALVRDSRIESQADREAAFLRYPGDAFAIYQVRSDGADENRFRLFTDLERLHEQGLKPTRDHYDLIYTGAIADHPSVTNPEAAFQVFNLERPGDFGGHSLSVSDIVAFRRNGVITYHYCDSVGFTEIPDFLRPENYLKNAEMAMEDDYGMLDGIINNGPKDSGLPKADPQQEEAHLNPRRLPSFLDRGRRTQEQQQTQKEQRHRREERSL